MNIKEALNFGKEYLDESNISDSLLKCRILLSKIFEVPKEYLIVHDLEELNINQEMKYKEYLARLNSNEPIQYITNSQEFMKLDFYVDESVLIPQPDTEILVEEILNICEKKENIKILDMCTGSGAIGICLAKYISGAEVIATDISKEAISVAKKNAEKNEVKISLVESDLFNDIYEDNFDIIVSNPPYIETDTIETLSEEVKKEPKIALDGGTDGLLFYRRIALDAKKYLKTNGILAIEIGYNQKEKVMEILKENNYKNIRCIKDLSNNDRAIICNKGG